MLPVVGVRGIVHADSEVLRAAVEEVSVLRELAGVALGIVVHYEVGFG